MVFNLLSYKVNISLDLVSYTVYLINWISDFGRYNDSRRVDVKHSRDTVKCTLLVFIRPYGYTPLALCWDHSFASRNISVEKSFSQFLFHSHTDYVFLYWINNSFYAMLIYWTMYCFYYILRSLCYKNPRDGMEENKSNQKLYSILLVFPK